MPRRKTLKDKNPTKLTEDYLIPERGRTKTRVPSTKHEEEEDGLFIPQDQSPRAHRATSKSVKRDSSGPSRYERHLTSRVLTAGRNPRLEVVIGHQPAWSEWLINGLRYYVVDPIYGFFQKLIQFALPIFLLFAATLLTAHLSQLQVARKLGDVPLLFLYEPLDQYIKIKNNCHTVQMDITTARQDIQALIKYVEPCSGSGSFLKLKFRMDKFIPDQGICWVTRTLEDIDADLKKFSLDSLKRVQKEIDAICQDMDWLPAQIDRGNSSFHVDGIVRALATHRIVGLDSVLKGFHVDISRLNDLRRRIEDIKRKHSEFDEEFRPSRAHDGIVKEPQGMEYWEEKSLHVKQQLKTISAKLNSDSFWRDAPQDTIISNAWSQAKSLGERIETFDKGIFKQDLDMSKIKETMDYVLQMPQSTVCLARAVKSRAPEAKKRIGHIQ